ncbi:MAG: helix-turn-helix domain-containing protein [Promethearchaeota archaeon]|jgi:predicted DNA binding protein
MQAFEVQIQAKIENPIHVITEKYPSLKIWTWCNYIIDIHEIVADNPNDFNDAIDEFKSFYSILNESVISSNIRLITQNCICSEKTTVHDNIQELEILNLMPVFASKGYEYYRLIAFKHESIEELFERLYKLGIDVEIQKKVPFDGMVSDNLITLNSLVSNLTTKQMEAIIAAFNNGYYQSPREVNVKKIAQRMHVPRTTLQEHLNKAENKLISSIIPQNRS